jgi:hypothetical protein
MNFIKYIFFISFAYPWSDSLHVKSYWVIEFAFAARSRVLEKLIFIQLAEELATTSETSRYIAVFSGAS